MAMELETSKEWTSDSNKDLFLYLGKEENNYFHPNFTYPIFGNAERIYGYKDLKIKIKFNSENLLPLLTINYSEKRDNADDVKNILMKYLSKDTLFNENEWIEKSPKNFIPPGEIISKLNHNNESYVVYKTSPTDALDIHLHAQIFILFYIEGGMYIDPEDTKWELYLLYKENKKESQLLNYEFIGFCTVYPYLWYNPKEKAPENISSLGKEPFLYYSRKRISQFLILPPFQRKGLGIMFFNILFNSFLNDIKVKEVTVEDPSEAFDNLRDLADLIRLSDNGFFETDEFKKLLNSPNDLLSLKDLQKNSKIAPRQFQRIIEIALTALINPIDNEKYTQYRLRIKARLYKHNKDQLDSLSKSDRIEKLDETFHNVVSHYKILLKSVPYFKSSSLTTERLKKRIKT